MGFDFSIAEPELRALFRFWLERLPRGGVPSRAEIDPALIPPAYLPHLFIYAQEADGQFACRLFGTALGRLYGRDETGQRLDPARRDPLHRSAGVFADVLASGLPVYDRYTIAPPAGIARAVGRLMLPIASRGNRPDQVFGMIRQIAAGEPAGTPADDVVHATWADLAQPA